MIRREVDKEEVARRIMNYLQKHPDAGDTLEGISKWWVKLERVDESVDNVSVALEELVKKRKIKKREIKGGSLIYRIPKNA